MPDVLFEEQLAIMIGQRISKFRRGAGMTQRELAEACGLRIKSVAQWETGRAYPTVRSLYTIAELFDCTLDDLVPIVSEREMSAALEAEA